MNEPTGHAGPAPSPQEIPRPAEARPGDPPPWAALDVPARRGLTVPAVRRALVRAGRGPDAVPPVVPDHGGAATRSAVLVALFEESGEARVVLTRRSADLRLHRGEVSFPGGRMDRGESVDAAALREAEEEVALAPSLVERVGWLPAVVTFGSRSHIQPVVGALARRPALAPNPLEVARVFDVALADLVADGAFHEERWRVPGREVPGAPDGWFPVWFFDVAGETVWGATARILMDLLTAVLGVGPART